MNILFKISFFGIEVVGVVVMLLAMFGPDEHSGLYFLGGCALMGPIMFIEGRISLRKEHSIPYSEEAQP